MQIFQLTFENDKLLVECDVERVAGVAAYHNIVVRDKETGREFEPDIMPEELALPVAVVLSAKLEE